MGKKFRRVRARIQHAVVLPQQFCPAVAANGAHAVVHLQKVALGVGGYHNTVHINRMQKAVVFAQGIGIEQHPFFGSMAINLEKYA